MRKADQRELEQLQDPETWAWDEAQIQPGNANPGLILEVRFRGPEAELLLSAADAAGVGTIQFVRQAAIAAAKACKQQPHSRPGRKRSPADGLKNQRG